MALKEVGRLREEDFRLPGRKMRLASAGGESNGDDGAGPSAAPAGPGPAMDFVPDEARPLLAQVGRMRSADYEAWVYTPMPGKPRFFQNDSLESITKVKWWVVPLFWLPVAALCLARSALSEPRMSAAAGAALLAAGVLLWQLIEYCLHRFLFHQRPKSPRAVVLHFLLHGCHHRYPLDTERLVFPPVPATWIAASIYGALRALLPLAVAGMLFGGVLLGYVAYDVSHYLMHSGRLGGRLKLAHMQHHYQDPSAGFGISSALYDVLFQTTPTPGRRRARLGAAASSRHKRQ